MNIDIQEVGERLRVVAGGKLDAVAANEFEEVVLGRMQVQPVDTLFHLADLFYICSSGLRVFLKAAKLARIEHTRVVLVSLQPRVKEIFDLTGFTQFFLLADGEEEALRLLEGQG